jgi:hypothetical protein
MYRVGNHQPQNVYRDDRYIGVMFDAADAALVVEALNAYPTGTETYACPICGADTWKGSRHKCVFITVNSCTCPPPSGPSTMPDPLCVVHQGRRARGPKPPPLGEGCICDGSGRTCPRHGAVI